MENAKYGKIEYRIFDPTGNITALVTTQVDPADQPAIASGIMDMEPDVEQVGFVTLSGAPGAGEPADGAAVDLRMAGGEFCGNAAMCAAALYMLRFGMQGEADVRIALQGTRESIDVRLGRRDLTSFDAAVTMPPAVSMDELRLADGAFSDSGSLSLPVVRMEGIAHVIIEPDSGFFGLRYDKGLAETLLRGWCGAIGADCLGMMFLDEGDGTRALTPLVYVPGADTMFWENSCASGSAAAGVYLARKAGKAFDVTFDEPGGRLRVESDPVSGRTILSGSLAVLER